jgi:subfamily B ATP-binding cassette protein MsbA
MIVFLFVVYKFIPYTQTLISELNLIFTQLPLVQIAIDAMSKKDKPYLKDGNKEIKNFKNKIELNNVNFSYLKGVPVLKNLNTSIEKNKITAIIGATGSGKSSLVNLLLRFYDVDSGNISIDGTDLKDLKNKSWLDIISYVPQDVFLFNLSVKENIRFGNLQATDKDVIIAAKTANAHDFISGLPEGYDTIIGERGVKVSGGQKQMIALARALIRQPQILILDEATSSLDNESERLVQRAIDKISKNITIIAIAHRLSTITNADKIIVLEKGKIVEEGNHTLIEESGHYEKFYNLQFQD